MKSRKRKEKNEEEEEEKRRRRYQIIVVLEGVVQGGDPLAVSVNQHVAFLPETRRLHTEAQKVE